MRAKHYRNLTFHPFQTTSIQFNSLISAEYQIIEGFSLTLLSLIRIIHLAAVDREVGLFSLNLKRFLSIFTSSSHSFSEENNSEGIFTPGESGNERKKDQRINGKHQKNLAFAWSDHSLKLSENFLHCRKTWRHFFIIHWRCILLSINRIALVCLETISVRLVSSLSISFNYKQYLCILFPYSASYPPFLFIFPRLHCAVSPRPSSYSLGYTVSYPPVPVHIPSGGLDDGCEAT